jgi:hypothetical protein
VNVVRFPASLRISPSLVLALICLALYLPSISGDFVYDARTTVLGNDYVHHPIHLLDVLAPRVISMDVMDNNRPVHLALVIFNWALWGANPAGHHVCSILFHALVVVLLFRFCRKLLPEASPWMIFSTVLLFAVHPVLCEPVAEISYRYDLIVTAFMLAALNLAAAFKPECSHRNVLFAVACVSCLFLAVGAKENGVAGPPVLICYWLLFRRSEPKAGWIALCAGASLVVLLFLAARFILPPENSIIFTQPPRYPGGSLQAAMLIQPRIWVFYFKQILWPQDLCAEYGPFSIRKFDFTISLLVLLGVLVGQIFHSARNRVFAFGAAVFWLALLPVSNIQPIYRPVADRFLYLPMTGVTFMLASVPWRHEAMRKVAVAVSMLAACAFACSTFQREKVWDNSLALWTDSVERNPYSANARVGLAGALCDAGRLGEAVREYENAIRLSKGKSADQFAGMAVALNGLGNKHEADEAFKTAVSMDPRYAHPAELVNALIWEQSDAAKLQVIADRNKN